MGYDQLDPEIVAALPEGSDVVSVLPHGTTRWSLGLKISVEIGEEEKEYFLKIIERSEWAPMAKAEYEAQAALTSVIPDNVVVPMAWGTFDNETKAYFITEFRNLRTAPPEPEQLIPVLKKLHNESVSPTGKFGFHMTTYWGPPPMVNDWTDSWEEYFSRQFRSDIAYLNSIHGKDPELNEMTDVLIEKVVARLLRPLQTNGRSIKPSLCHGDLWDGNVQYDLDTEQPIIFDSCAFYGHNEVDLQAIGDPRYVLGAKFVEMYADEVGKSEPRQDFEDRHNLYGIRNNIVVAAICPDQAHLIDLAKRTMKQLIEKFPDGLAGFCDPKTPITTPIFNLTFDPSAVLSMEKPAIPDSPDSAYCEPAHNGDMSSCG